MRYIYIYAKREMVIMWMQTFSVCVLQVIKLSKCKHSWISWNVHQSKPSNCLSTFYACFINILSYIWSNNRNHNNQHNIKWISYDNKLFRYSVIHIHSHWQSLHQCFTFLYTCDSLCGKCEFRGECLWVFATKSTFTHLEII